MYYQTVQKTQQSVPMSAHNTVGLGAAPIEVGPAPGGWQLDNHRALTLKSAQAGVLHVVRGRVWATLSGPHAGALGLLPDDSGDVVLRSGEQLAVPPHQRLVIEPWGRCADDPAFFSWEPVAA